MEKHAKTPVDPDALPEAEAAPETAVPEVETGSEADKLKMELAELQAKFLYLQAEYQNFRKRAARDLSAA